MFINPKIPIPEMTANGNILCIFSCLILYDSSTINLAAAIQNAGNNGIKWKNETKIYNEKKDKKWNDP